VKVKPLTVKTSDSFENGNVPPSEIPETVRARFGIGNKVGKFISHGSFGYVIRYGDKVLKVTADEREVVAAARVIGSNEKSLYRVFGAVTRKVPMSSFSRGVSPTTGYIWQEFLEKPNYEMTQAVLVFKRFTGLLQTSDRKKSVESIRAGITELISIVDGVGYEGDARSIEDALQVIELDLSRRKSKETGLRRQITTAVVHALDAYSMTRYHLNNKKEAKKIFKYVKQLDKTNRFLRKLNIIYNDYHPGNVMRRGNDIVLIDLGLAIVLDNVTVDVLQGLLGRYVERIL